MEIFAFFFQKNADALGPTGQSVSRKWGLCLQLFNNWFVLFGLPDWMVSDRDKIFTSRVWRKLLQCAGVKRQLLTSYHPQTDGRTERTNKTMVEMLWCLIDRRQGRWRQLLSAVENAMNLAVNKSMGKTPLNLIFGFIPRLFPLGRSAEGEVCWEEQEAEWYEARDNLLRLKVDQFHFYNLQHRPEVELEVGD